MPSLSVSVGGTKPGAPSATTLALPAPLLLSSRECDESLPAAGRRDEAPEVPEEVVGVVVPSTPPAVVMSTEPGAATGPTTPTGAVAARWPLDWRVSMVSAGRLTVSAGPSLDELSESGQLFQPTSGAAIAPTPR